MGLLWVDTWLFSLLLLMMLVSTDLWSSLVWPWHQLLQLTCWPSELIRPVLVCCKGKFHRYGLSLIDSGPASVNVIIKALFGWDSGRDFRSSERSPIQSYGLLPEMWRECHGLVALWETRAYVSILDPILIGLISCLCGGCWVLEDQKLRGC